MRAIVLLLIVCMCSLVFCDRVLAGKKVLCDFEADAAEVTAVFKVPEACVGKLEIVPGKVGEKALKITFLTTSSVQGSRWCNIDINREPKLDPKTWVRENYTAVKFWLKGDGSETMVQVRAEYYDPVTKQWTTLGMGPLAEFSLEDPEWKQVVIPLKGENKELLSKTTSLSLTTGPKDIGFYYIIDHITAE